MDDNIKTLQSDAGVKGADLTNNEAISIPVIHESVVINKSVIETGRIKIKKIINEEDQLVNISLEHDEVEIKTIPINQFVDDIPGPVRYEGDVMIIPVLKEVSVIRIMLEKEIHITKKKVITENTQTISLRKEEVSIENVTSANQNHEPGNQ